MNASTALATTRIVVIAVYLLAVLISYRWLIPRLPSNAKKLTTLLLAAQVLTTMLSLDPPGTSRFVRWVWHLNGEYNIPSTLASTQWLLVGVVSLFTAWLSRKVSAWQRIYFFGLALVFLHLARDEFFVVHEQHSDWQSNYLLLGGVLAAATILVAMRSPRRYWLWYSCLLGGLAIGAAGAIGLEEIQFDPVCRKLGFFGERGCLTFFIEESLEFLGAWLALIAMAGFYSIAVRRPHPNVRRLLFLVTLTWILFIHAPYAVREIELRLLYQPAAVTYESDVALRAYQLGFSERTLTLDFFATVDEWRAYQGFGYSIHLIDQVSGDSVAGVNVSASRLYSVPYYAAAVGDLAYKQQIKVVARHDTPVNRALWAVLTAWLEVDEQFVRQRIVSSSHRLLSDYEVVLGEVVIPSASAAAAPARPLAKYEDGFMLAAANLPASARPGEALAIAFNWRAEDEVAEDYVQFLHIGDESTGEWWVYDQAPLGGRLPTRLWYSGLAESEVWQVPLPADLAPGRYLAYTGLYRVSDLERLPARDVAGAPFPDARVPLGSVVIEQG